MSFRIHGIAATEAALKRREIEARAAAPKASEAGAAIVGRAIVARAPRDTGATAASVRVSSGGETASVGPETSYARFPEFGTRYMSGQHYVQDASDASQGEVAAVIAAIMKAAVEG